VDIRNAVKPFKAVHKWRSRVRQSHHEILDKFRKNWVKHCRSVVVFTTLSIRCRPIFILHFIIINLLTYIHTYIHTYLLICLNCVIHCHFPHCASELRNN